MAEAHFIVVLHLSLTLPGDAVPTEKDAEQMAYRGMVVRKSTQMCAGEPLRIGTMEIANVTKME